MPRISFFGPLKDPFKYISSSDSELLLSMSVIQHKKGHPTRAERIKIRKELEPYYEKNIPAYKAAEITGYDVKTVNKYYDQLSNEIYGYDAKHYVERYRKARTRCARHLDTQIRKSYENQERVESEMQKLTDVGETIPSHLFLIHSKITQDISRLVEKEAALMMSPDPRDMMEEAMKESKGDGNT